ncbi:MAG: hypothetical protein LUF92_15575 [Clostridiales bacterium]|nr:hypothetical protein [Clostridiales bacterium]
MGSENMNTIEIEKEMVTLHEICDEASVGGADATGKIIKKPIHFVSMETMIEGALQFVALFEWLHRNGKVYCSDRADAFRFSLQTGKMIFDEPEEKYVEISEFLAPELIEDWHAEEDVVYTVETDRYFMAVFLFEYFFHTGSPFEGKKMVNRCFLSPLEKERFRAEQGQFCMEIGENDNAPVRGIQDKLIHYWEEYPDFLKKMFQRAFMDGGRLCELRPTEVDWKQALVRMAMDYKVCKCGFQGFSDRLHPEDNGTFSCPKCGKIYYVLTDGMDRFLLADGGKLYECQTGRDLFNKDKVTGLVVENRQKKGLYGIKNVSKGVWRGMFPDGTVKEITEGQGIPIWNGMMIRFETGEEWRLRLQSPEVCRDHNEGEADTLA